MLLQKGFVVPVRLCPATHTGFTRIEVNQASADTTHCRVSKTWHYLFQNVRLIETRGIRKENDLAASFLDRSILSCRLAETSHLTMKNYARRCERSRDLIRAIS